MDKKLIGQRIRRLREEKRQTKRYVAKQLGISYSALCQFEYGIMVPGDDLKMQIAKYFGTTVGKLFFAEENNET